MSLAASAALATLEAKAYPTVDPRVLVDHHPGQSILLSSKVSTHKACYVRRWIGRQIGSLWKLKKEVIWSPYVYKSSTLECMRRRRLLRRDQAEENSKELPQEDL
ncbi:hypothetical protein KEM48_004379 [Puccinia striiformis f. sp. tritici PST-130]|nr:hypothetical protein KEM48_004379 [Puccinia striiformis f. sp. tritici PST-130]